jgi:hypothetical protein
MALLLTPVKAYADYCIAECPNDPMGDSWCYAPEGDTCSAEDGVGCAVYDENGEFVMGSRCIEEM